MAAIVHGPLSPSERETARTIFSGKEKDIQPCGDCGGIHARACPRIRSEKVVFDYAVGQRLLERHVEYWQPGTWEKDVIWAEDVFEDDERGRNGIPAVRPETETGRDAVE